MWFFHFWDVLQKVASKIFRHQNLLFSEKENENLQISNDSYTFIVLFEFYPSTIIATIFKYISWCTGCHFQTIISLLTCILIPKWNSFSWSWCETQWNVCKPKVYWIESVSFYATIDYRVFVHCFSVNLFLNGEKRWNIYS